MQAGSDWKAAELSPMSMMPEGALTELMEYAQADFGSLGVPEDKAGCRDPPLSPIMVQPEAFRDTGGEGFRQGSEAGIALDAQVPSKDKCPAGRSVRRPELGAENQDQRMLNYGKTFVCLCM